MTALIVTAGTVLAVAAAWLAAAHTDSDPQHVAPAADALALEQGRVYYLQLCMDCHGMRGDGQGEWAYRVTPRPANLRSAGVRARSDAEIDRFIAEGIPGSPMIGVKLSEAQRRQLAGYVRYLGENRERTPR